MKLGELLKTKEPGLQVKIGAIHGSSFFFCGTVQECLDGMEELDKVMADKTKTAAVRERKSFMKAVVDGFKWEVNLEPRKKDDESLETWTQQKIADVTKLVARAFDEWIASLGIRKANAIEAERLSLEEKGIADREVVETFMASGIVEPTPTLNIMVHGWEYGEYWMTEEAKEPKTGEKS